MKITTHTPKSLFCWFFIAAVLAAGSLAAWANSVGVHFVNAGGNNVNNSSADALAPTDLAGASAYAQTNWNNLGSYGSSAGSAVVLTNSAGAATSLSIMWDSAGVGDSGTTNLGTPNGKLMDGYITTYSGGSGYGSSTGGHLGNSVSGNDVTNRPLAYIGNLKAWYQAQGAVGYKVVLYVTGPTYYESVEGLVESVSGSPFSSTMVEGSTLLAPPLYAQISGVFSGTFNALTSQNSSSPSGGSGYMVFNGLTDDAVLVRMLWGGYGGGISGIQIVPVFATLKSSVGVHFVNSGSGGIDNSPSDSLSTTETAGAPGYAQANWNNLSRWGSGVTLNNSVGNATSLAIQWDAQAVVTTGTGSGLGTPDGKLMDASLYSYDWNAWSSLANDVYGSGNNNKPLIYIGNIQAWYQAQGAIGYRVLVYVDNGNHYWQTVSTSLESVTGSPLSSTMVEGSVLQPARYAQINGDFSGTYTEITSTNSGSPTGGGSGYIAFDTLTNDAVLIRQNNGGAMGAFQIVPVFAPQPSVGVHFVNGGGSYVNNSATSSLLPSETAGAPNYAQANWNNLDRYGDGVTLTNSVGAATALSINWDAGYTSTFSDTAALGTPDGKLMSDALGGSGNVTDYTTITNNNSVYAMPGGAKPMVYVGGLNAWCAGKGAVGYTVVVYQNDNNWYGNDQMWVESVTGNYFSTMVAGPDLTPHLWNQNTSTFSGTYNQIPNTSTNQSGDAGGKYYGIFSGLTNDAVLIRTGTADYMHGSLNGFQIIPILAPTVTQPTVNNFMLAARSGVPATIQVLSGKHTPTIVTGGALTVTAVTYASGNGASVSTDGTNVTYTASSSFTGTDVFTYTVSDATGVSATATVTVNVTANGSGYNALSAPVALSGNDYRLSYVGVPGFNYALDWTASLAAPVSWTPQSTNMADANGLLIITNNQTGSPNFWRTRYVP